MERLPAPSNAAEASAQVEDVYAELVRKRTSAKRWRNLHAFAEHLYREASAMARMRVDGKSEDVRTAQVHESPVPDRIREDADQLVREMGLREAADTVGDLRWLRDRAKDLAESSTEAAYDERERLKSRMTVSAMAKQEAEFAHLGDADIRPLRRGA